MANYNFLGAYRDHRLCEVVMPGAHDAGVYTANAENVQTQNLNISAQAWAGCRFFDMRIATVKHKDGTLEQKAFHLDPKLVRNHSIGQKTSYQNVGHLGGWGGGLDEMLKHARDFVRGGVTITEFLILKFSKCYNWENVAQACLDGLGDAQYKEPGPVNLNNKLCRDLSGKVITVFDEESRKTLGKWKANKGAAADGIKFIRNLYDKKTGRSKGYEPLYDGIQYFGKFSSTDDIHKNQKKQQKLLTGGASTDIDAMGMMYWTTTAMKQNIFNRNETMWDPPQIAKLKETWQAGLESAIKHRFGSGMEIVMQMLKNGHGSYGNVFKSFMPNIVMMDFVNDMRCSTIIGLNDVAPNILQDMMLKSAENAPGDGSFKRQRQAFRVGL